MTSQRSRHRSPEHVLAALGSRVQSAVETTTQMRSRHKRYFLQNRLNSRRGVSAGSAATGLGSSASICTRSPSPSQEKDLETKQGEGWTLDPKPIFKLQLKLQCVPTPDYKTSRLTLQTNSDRNMGMLCDRKLDS
jgi:hypothetical protein